MGIKSCTRAGNLYHWLHWCGAAYIDAKKRALAGLLPYSPKVSISEGVLHGHDLQLYTPLTTPSAAIDTCGMKATDCKRISRRPTEGPTDII